MWLNTCLVPLMAKVQERLAEPLFLSGFYRDNHPFLVHLSACLCAYLICLKTGCIALLLRLSKCLALSYPFVWYRYSVCQTLFLFYTVFDCVLRPKAFWFNRCFVLVRPKRW